MNDWVAEDLSLSPRDSVQVSWFEVGPLRQLEEKHRMLAVKRIVPLLGAYADSTLMPSIPGISDAGHCREWEAGVPVDLSLIRQKDEDYWNRYREHQKSSSLRNWPWKHGQTVSATIRRYDSRRRRSMKNI